MTKRIPITAENVRRYLPCTFERLHQVFIECAGVRETDPKYPKLRARLSRCLQAASSKRIVRSLRSDARDAVR